MTQELENEETAPEQQQAVSRESGKAVPLDSLLERACTLIAWIEYDLALEALDQAEALVRTHGDSADSLRLELLRAAIHARRGDQPAAAAGLDAAISEALRTTSADVTTQGLMSALQPTLLSPILLRGGRRQLEHLLQLGPGTLSASLRQRGQELLNLDLEKLPQDIGLWLSFDGMAPQEAAVRRSLARLEQRRETSIPMAECFQHLWQTAYRGSRDVSRLLDLARGYRLAARRSGSAQQIAHAWSSLATSYDLDGRPEAAITAYQRALETDPEQVGEPGEDQGIPTDAQPRRARAKPEDGEAAAKQLAGRIRNLSELARLHFRAGQLEPAISAASRSLALSSSGGGPPKARLVSLTYLALALGQQGRWMEAQITAQRRQVELRATPIEGDEAIESILEQLASGQAEAGDETGRDPLETAHLLGTLGLIEDALTGIDDALDQLDSRIEARIEAEGAGNRNAPDVETLPPLLRLRASMLGTKANILNQAGDLEAAKDLFAEAAARFYELGEAASHLEAERQAARCSAQLGHRDAAEARLHSLLEDLPPGSARGSLLRTLAGLVQQRLHDQGASAPEFRPAAEQTAAWLEEAAAMPGLNQEDLGLNLFNLALTRLRLLHDATGSEQALLKAEPHLEAAGSPHLELCRQLLRSLSRSEASSAE